MLKTTLSAGGLIATSLPRSSLMIVASIAEADRPDSIRQMDNKKIQ